MRNERVEMRIIWGRSRWTRRHTVIAWVARHAPRRVRIAIHEAARLVVARSLGQRVDEACITPDSITSRGLIVISTRSRVTPHGFILGSAEHGRALALDQPALRAAFLAGEAVDVIMGGPHAITIVDREKARQTIDYEERFTGIRVDAERAIANARILARRVLLEHKRDLAITAVTIMMGIPVRDA